MHSTVQHILSRNLLDCDKRRPIGCQTGKRNRVTGITSGADIVTRKKRNAGDVFTMVAPKHGARGCHFFDESGRVRKYSLELYCLWGLFRVA